MEKELQEQLGFIIENMATKNDLQSLRTEMKSDIAEMNQRLDQHDKQFSEITQRLDQHDKQFSEVKSEIREMKGEIREMRDDIDFVRGVTVNLENNIVRRIESIFEGYSLTSEKQKVLERRVDKLEQRVDVVEIKLA